MGRISQAVAAWFDVHRAGTSHVLLYRTESRHRDIPNAWVDTWGRVWTVTDIVREPDGRYAVYGDKGAQPLPNWEGGPRDS